MRVSLRSFLRTHLASEHTEASFQLLNISPLRATLPPNFIIGTIMTKSRAGTAGWSAAVTYAISHDLCLIYEEINYISASFSYK